ncbi:hypothetical protein MIR68_001976 [Amoeboaphelidium protococcarum]|nr:hypothetical protein MIR68_001976 [Amoeboaphelidium protococcarum]KAI3643997.1 hypothetical protein MP228_010161 [Amoeboaphelidium protococcarum]
MGHIILTYPPAAVYTLVVILSLINKKFDLDAVVAANEEFIVENPTLAKKVGSYRNAVADFRRVQRVFEELTENKFRCKVPNNDRHLLLPYRQIDQRNDRASSTSCTTNCSQLLQEIVEKGPVFRGKINLEDFTEAFEVKFNAPSKQEQADHITMAMFGPYPVRLIQEMLMAFSQATAVNLALFAGKTAAVMVPVGLEPSHVSIFVVPFRALLINLQPLLGRSSVPVEVNPAWTSTPG